MLTNKKILVIIAGVLLIIALAVVLVVKNLVSTRGPVTLTWWGLWETGDVYQTVIDDFKRSHPNVTVKYQKMSAIQYRDRVTAALSREGGPDIVRIHNTWLPMMKNYLQPIAASDYPAANFKNDFYPVASADLVSNGVVWAVPSEIDTLVLYVNQDILTAGGVSIPTTWEDFRTAASKLTIKDSNGRVTTSGAAVGTASNVAHWQDILGLMMLQAGVDLSGNPNSKEAQDALAYYTTFASVDQVWNDTLDESTLAFANGKVAMYFGPSWRYFDIKNINPNLNFKMAKVPQLNGGDSVSYASYWAEAVSKKTEHPKEVAEFLKFLTTKEELSKVYSLEAQQRGFGEPYPRVDMVALLANDPNVGVVMAQAPAAQSWYLASNTNDGDTGINSRIGKYYLDAVNTMVRGGDPKSVLDTVASGVSQVLSSYGISSAVKATRTPAGAPLNQ